jgi:hypothetical protein
VHCKSVLKDSIMNAKLLPRHALNVITTNIRVIITNAVNVSLGVYKVQAITYASGLSSRVLADAPCILIYTTVRSFPLKYCQMTLCSRSKNS